CRDVHISGCHIDVGDDCIAIKAGTEATAARVPCENITVTGCTMVHGHGGVVIGSEMAGGVRNVVISACVFQGTDRGIRVRSRAGRGGLIANLRVTGIVMDDVISPITVNSFYHCGPEGKTELVGDRSARPVGPDTPVIRGLHLAHLTATRVHASAGHLFGLPELPLEDLSIEDLSVSFAEAPRPVGPDTPVIRGLHLAHLTATRVHASAGHLFGLPESPLEDLSIEDLSVSFAEDPRPGVPEMADGLVPVTREGLRLGGVRGALLSRVRVRGADGPLLRLEDCEGVVGEVTER